MKNTYFSLDKGSLGLSGCVLPRKVIDLVSKSLESAIDLKEVNLSDHYLNEDDLGKFLKSLSLNE